MKKTVRNDMCFLLLSLLTAVLVPAQGQASSGQCEYRVEYEIYPGYNDQVLGRFENCEASHPCENTKDNNKKLVREGTSLRIWHKADNAQACANKASIQCRLDKDIQPKKYAKHVLSKKVSVNFAGREVTTDVCQTIAKANSQKHGSSRMPASAETKKAAKSQPRKNR